MQLDVFETCDPRFHPQQWPSSDVKLTNFDLLAKITNELVERYDVIHLRLLLLEFQPELMSAGELIKNFQASSDDAQHWPRI